MKRIAVSVFDNQVATVLDYSTCFLLVVMDGEQVQRRLEMAISPESAQMFFEALEAFHADVLICGAVSSSLLESLARRGIEAISCVRGPVDQVLRAYAQGKLAEKRFRLPGPTLAAPSRSRRSGSGRSSRKSFRWKEAEG